MAASIYQASHLLDGQWGKHVLPRVCRGANLRPSLCMVDGSSLVADSELYIENFSCVGCSRRVEKLPDTRTAAIC